MAATGAEGTDFFRLWLESNRALFETGAGPLWPKCEGLFREWARFAEAFAGAHAERAGRADASPFDPAGWLRSEGGGGMADLLRWLEGPDLPRPLGEHARAMQGTREWLAYLTAAEQMKGVLAEGWLGAFRAFAAAAAEEDDAARAVGAGRPDWDRLKAIWHDCAAQRLAETYRAPAFLAAQRDLVRAETDLRRSMRERVEAVAEELGLPTRAELDDIHESLHALSREMRRRRRGSPAPAE